ncbi:MAG: type I-G CRISPR-associated helicase/endonuclease Cas3g [Egibacteraceae bacterium]
MGEYAGFFRNVTGCWPFPFQEAMAGRSSPVVAVPTGFGKTEGVVVPWLYAHARGDEVTTRLFYCLPMRVLVEQIHRRIEALVAAAGVDVAVRRTLGGAVVDDWVDAPDRPTIVVGTVDLLISRALNRGYAASPGMWPAYFAACHSDATWVLDEVQLFGAALPTTLQLQAFRAAFGAFGRTETVWMSATIPAQGLATVDHPAIDAATYFTITDQDKAHDQLGQRWTARKTGEVVEGPPTAEGVLGVHDHALDRYGEAAFTLAVVNTVKDAQDLHKRLGARLRRAKRDVPLAPLHSRFRPLDRAERTTRLEEVAAGGGIAVCTQVVEAGVDLDASALVTELCPWPSLVQRLGRVNRRGRREAPAEVRIHGTPAKLDGKPYPAAALQATADRLRPGADLSPAALSAIPAPADPQRWSVVRRADLLQLFDTTPSLEGEHTSVAEWVRDVEQVHVWVGWRPGAPSNDPDQPEPALAAAELCPVPIGEAREYLRRAPLWLRSRVDGQWSRAQADEVRPGIQLCADAAQGGYHPEIGWAVKAAAAVPPVAAPTAVADDVVAGDAERFTDTPLTLADHSLDARAEAERICAGRARPLLSGLASVVRQAAWLHDVGKAHGQFQDAVRKINPELDGDMPWAKSGRLGRLCFERGFYRHEVASALRVADAVAAGEVDCADPDLLVYLVGAHHGKARMGIPLPQRQDDPDHYVAGLDQDDPLPEIDCGDGLRLVAWTVSNLDAWSHVDGGRWAAIARRLLAAHGPFRLAYLEWLVRAADWAASKSPGRLR